MSKQHTFSKYQYSGDMGARLSTSHAARESRVHRAMESAGIPIGAIQSIKSTSQASASIATLKGGIQCLVSYNTLVAVKFSDGQSMSQYRNYYSVTTQRSVDDFTRGQAIVEHDAMCDAIKLKLQFA